MYQIYLTQNNVIWYLYATPAMGALETCPVSFGSIVPLILRYMMEVGNSSNHATLIQKWSETIIRS